jgi:hypothetical protein
LGIFKSRLPARDDVFIVLSAILVAVFSWSILGFLFVYPSLVLRYATLEIFAIFSYMMAFASVESILVFGCLVLVSAILPKKWLREGFSYKGFLVVLIGSIAFIQYQTFLGGELPEVKTVFLWAGSYLFVLICLILLFHFVQHLQTILVSVAERFTVFAYVYIPLGFLGLIVVILRNLFKG